MDLSKFKDICDIRLGDITGDNICDICHINTKFDFYNALYKAEGIELDFISKDNDGIHKFCICKACVSMLLSMAIEQNVKDIEILRVENKKFSERMERI